MDERDWERWTRGLWGLGLETYPLRVVLRVDGEDKPTELPVLLPHEVYHAMHEKSVQLFLQSVVGDEGLGALLSFWEQALTERWAAKHPAFADPSRLDRMVPVRFWIDGVEVYSDAETTYVAFASATGHGAHPSLHHLWMAGLNLEKGIVEIRPSPKRDRPKQRVKRPTKVVEPAASDTLS